MNFICKELTLEDDGVFGCTIDFSNTLDKEGDQNSSELIDPNHKYFLVQRSYGEDFDEDDYYSMETTESDIELSYKDKLSFELSTERVKIMLPHKDIIIGLNLDKEEYNALKKLIKKRFKKMIVLTES